MRWTLDVPFFALGDGKGTTVMALRIEKLPRALNSVACLSGLRSLLWSFAWPYEHDLSFL